MNEFQGARVIVLGLAKSGVAVAKRLHRLGAQIVANDRKNRNQCPEAEELELYGISVICGEHPLELLDQPVDLIVKNPGIPYHIPFLQQAQRLQIPIVTEVEIASRLSPIKTIAITGSNGKTTTTTLVGEMLRAAEIDRVVAGNIGTALSDVEVVENDPRWLVAELSSFQLKGTYQFHPRIAALLNIYPAHLDYHQTMEDYIASKARLFQNQGPEDVAVLNYDHPLCVEMQAKTKAQVVWFSREQEVDRGVFVRQGQMVARLGKQEETILAVEELRLPGDVNLENALAATAIAWSAGAKVPAIQEVLRTFTGVEHRLEYVRTVDGVAYYNDSKATNAQAATKALESFTQPVVWIAGGLDRGVDFHELVPVLRKHVKAAVFYGQTSDCLTARAKEAEIEQVLQASEMSEAVALSAKLAAAGDVVLLSPACASWDQYTSFEERGRIFKQAVHTL
jgi:UDP-N-acetylmuramoylalanine--D-glutamate ligase